MDRFPLLIYLGAGILAKVGGDMIFQDAFVANEIHLSTVVRYLVDCALIAAVLFGGKRISSSRLEAASSSLEPE
jgi:hypothetical protein